MQDFLRNNPQACEPFASRIQSYCDFDDLYCAQGKSLIVHISYVVKYGTDAMNFIMKKYDAMKTVPTTAAGSSATASATSSTATSSSMSANAATRGAEKMTGGLFVALAVAVVALAA